MDRRSFVIGTAALAATGPARAQDTSPRVRSRSSTRFRPAAPTTSRHGPSPQRLSPSSNNRWSSRPRQAPEARLVHRLPPMQSRTAIRCCRTTMESPATRRSTDCSDGNRKPLRADFYPVGSTDSRSGACACQRSTTVPNVKGLYRRRQEAARSDNLQFRRAVRRHSFAGGASRKSHGHTEASPFCRPWRRAGNYRSSRQQCPNEHAERCLTSAAAHQSRQTAPVGVFRRQANGIRPRCADAQRTRLCRGILLVGWHFRARRAHPLNIVATLSAAIDKAGTSDAYKTAMSNAGLQADYLNAAGFAKFWAEDAKQSDEAVKLIGRVQG